MRVLLQERDSPRYCQFFKVTYGLFQKVPSEEDRDRLKQDPVPNRHAAIHGLVVYSSPQNSLNAIFIADYIFRIVTPSITSAMMLPHRSALHKDIANRISPAIPIRNS